jgi:hypothetical protein
LVLVTSSGLVTSVSWWTTLAADGDTVKLKKSCEDAGCVCPPDELVVAVLRSDAEASAFHRIATDEIRLKARRFEANEWPSLLGAER